MVSACTTPSNNKTECSEFPCHTKVSSICSESVKEFGDSFAFDAPVCNALSNEIHVSPSIVFF